MWQKPDQNPADWVPPSPDVRFRYVAEWVATKLRRQFTADDRELEALKVYADGPCEDTIVRCTPAARPTRRRERPARPTSFLTAAPARHRRCRAGLSVPARTVDDRCRSGRGR